MKFNLHKILCHVNLVFTGVLLILVILDGYNPTMEYLSSKESKIFIVIFIVTTTVQLILTIAKIRAGERRRAR